MLTSLGNVRRSARCLAGVLSSRQRAKIISEVGYPVLGWEVVHRKG
jgi:hypothetical protein